MSDSEPFADREMFYVLGTTANAELWYGLVRVGVYGDREEAENTARVLNAAVDRKILAERRRCAEIAELWANSKSCTDGHDDNPCCHVRTGRSIADKIMEEPK